jgi:UDP-N-acetylglucosamine transferase subunit ALG13
LEQGLLRDEVIAQVGYSDYKPKNFKVYQFMDKNIFENHIQQADVIIAHSGVGTIMSGLRLNKPVIVFPRLKKFNEHVDNHQIEIAKAFVQKNYVLSCENENHLLDIIEKSKTIEFETYISSKQRIISLIEDFIGNA